MIKKTIPWLLVLVWMFVIFNFSSETIAASRTKSIKVTKAIGKVTTSILESNNSEKKQETPAPNNNFEFKELVVRKTAHFIEYLILAILLTYALTSSGVKGRKTYLITAAIAITFASLDEYHQLFIEGRSGRVRDIFIDSAGVLSGMLIGAVYHYRTVWKYGRNRNC